MNKAESLSCSVISKAVFQLSRKAARCTLTSVCRFFSDSQQVYSCRASTANDFTDYDPHRKWTATYERSGLDSESSEGSSDDDGPGGSSSDYTYEEEEDG